MPLKIYGVLRSRASRVVWLAYETGIPFELAPVIQAYRLSDPNALGAPLNTASPEFRAVNPNGLIPTIDDDGFVLHESLAINLYLAKKHGGPLAPVDVREDGLMTMWSLWAATECEPHTLQVLYHRLSRPEKERDPAVAEAAVSALRRPFGVLDAALREGMTTSSAAVSRSRISMSPRCSATRNPRPSSSQRRRTLSAGSKPANRGRRSYG